MSVCKAAERWRRGRATAATAVHKYALALFPIGMKRKQGRKALIQITHSHTYTPGRLHTHTHTHTEASARALLTRI